MNVSCNVGIKCVENSDFSRTDTKAIKGFAVVLMLFHHIAGFPDRYPIDFLGYESYWTVLVEHGYLQDFALAAKICVSLFFFIGGYGFFIRRKSSNVSVINEISRLYCVYWRVFIIFIPIGILFFANGTEVLNDFSVRFLFDTKREMITSVLSNFIGYSSSLNGEWWFFKSYICAIILGRLFCEYTDKNKSFWKDIFIVFIMDILIGNVFPALAKAELLSSLRWNLYYNEFFSINNYSTAYFAGIIFAKYNGISWIRKKIQNIPYSPLVSVLGVCSLYLMRAYILGNTADIIYCALMIPMLCIFFDKCKIIKCIFVFLGKHSSNIWLVHSFYCYYFLPVTQLVFCTRNVWVDLMILVLISLATSIALEWFYGLIKQLYRKDCFTITK